VWVASRRDKESYKGGSIKIIVELKRGKLTCIHPGFQRPRNGHYNPRKESIFKDTTLENKEMGAEIADSREDISIITSALDGIGGKSNLL